MKIDIDIDFLWGDAHFIKSEWGQSPILLDQMV